MLARPFRDAGAARPGRAAGHRPARRARVRRLARLHQPLPRVQPERLQQPVAGRAAARLRLHERLVDQLADEVEHLPRLDGPAAPTCSAASSGKPPANTAARRSTARSGSESRA